MKKRLLSFLLTLVVVLVAAISAMAAESDTGFSDVAEGAWYAEAAVYCRDNGLMSGITADTFAPNTTMTRGMLAAVLYRAAGSPQIEAENTFSDVAEGAWYTDAVLWAQQNGIVSGYGSGQFGTGDPVTREQIASILWRYEESPAAGSSAGFADQAAISSWAADAVNWARETGLINGKDGNRFDPKGNATRAEVAVILMRYTQGENQTPNPEPADETKVLVAYFSCTNTTKTVAEYAADALNADLYEIQPQVPYTAEDLNYGNDSSRTSLEMNDSTTRPAISGSVENMEEYDIVFVGYPIWWGEAPKIISTFLESYDFSGKTIVPFCTSGSSGIGSSASHLHSLCSDTTTWLDGTRFGGGTSRAAMVEWINGLNLGVAAE